MRAADSGPFDLTAGPRISEHTELVADPRAVHRPVLLRSTPVGSMIQERSQSTLAPDGLPQRFPARGCGASSIQSAGSRRGSGFISGLTRFRSDGETGSVGRPRGHTRSQRPIRGPPLSSLPTGRPVPIPPLRQRTFGGGGRPCHRGRERGYPLTRIRPSPGPLTGRLRQPPGGLR
jgi:hypothetical protein